MPPTTRRRPSSISPRHLVLRHARRLIAARSTDSTDPPELAKGEERLYSFYAPALEAGVFTVTAAQTTISPNSSDPQLNLTTTQTFTVTAPRFALPDGILHSTYPPQGHGDTVETLPHVVFSDPHLPWERIASTHQAADEKRNRVPWLAVLLFTPDELRLSDDALGAAGIFSGTTLTAPVTQSTTMAVEMSIGDLWKTTATSTPIAQDEAEPIDPTTTTDVVFLKPALFTALFTADDGSADVSRYKFLAHVRNINTTGMADAGVEDDGLFSIVVSHRVGPLNITQPSPVVVHLVSIEGVEDMTLPLPSSTQYVALASLHSWTYTCLPPTAFNVFEAFQNLGNTLGVLRPVDATIAAAAAEAEPLGPRVARRLKDGYTVTRYRTQTGETTAALLRGALTGTNVPHPLTSDWTSVSNSGGDLQVLDQEVGLMDVTYGVAWQLGKTLAMANRAFTAALGRLRTQIFDDAMNRSKMEVLGKLSAYKTKAEMLSGLTTSFATLAALPDSRRHHPHHMLHRWARPSVPVPDLKFGSPHVAPIFAAHARSAARDLAAADGTDEQYDETNTPASTDWMTVLQWVLDRMFLDGISAQYLIVDPTHLPEESLRFFSIDANWIDALVDGALSVANHTIDLTDPVRAAIKEAINDYLQNTNKVLQYAPQVPTHGFLLRSKLVTIFPDLVVSTSPDPADGRAPLLRHENIADGVMLCLFDRAPGAEDFTTLTFGQPPHQQSFVAAAELTAQQLVTSYKRVYTVQDPVDPHRADELGEHTWMKGDSQTPVFVWGDNNEVRTLKFPEWAEDVFNYIKTHIQEIDPTYFTDTIPSAALCGIQLNNPIYQLNIQAQTPKTAAFSTAPSRPRTLQMLRAPRGHPKPVHKAPRHPPPPRWARRQIVLRPLPPPHHRVRLTPLLLRAPPPHYPAHRATTRTTRIVRSSKMANSGPAQPPIFRYSVHPVETAVEAVPTYKDVPQDLVFGIVLQSGADDDFHLKQIVLTVPMGGMNPPSPVNLLTNYQGPGATMLSNLRFNISVGFTTTAMVLKVVPRSSSERVPIKRVPEASFVLSLVDVNAWKTDTKVKMTIQEIYEETSLPYNYDIKLVAE